MGIQYLDINWHLRQPAREPWPAAATATDWAEYRYHAAAAATLIAALALVAAPALVAILAIVGTLR